jgi:hypothetical protein
MAASGTAGRPSRSIRAATSAALAATNPGSSPAGPPADPDPALAGPALAGPAPAGPVPAGPVPAGPVLAGPVLTEPRTRSAPRLSRATAPAAFPRRAWVSPTAIWARPRHSSLSGPAEDFHAASNTSCAWNGRPSASRRPPSATASSGVTLRSSGIAGTPSAAVRGSGRPSSSRGRAFRGRPPVSLSRLLTGRPCSPVGPAHRSALLTGRLTGRARRRPASRAVRRRRVRAAPRAGSGRRPR